MKHDLTLPSESGVKKTEFFKASASSWVLQYDYYLVVWLNNLYENNIFPEHLSISKYLSIALMHVRQPH